MPVHHNHNDAIGVIATVFFSAVSWLTNSLDWSYADSVFIGPLQHIVSIISGLIAIIIGLPLAAKQVIKFYHFIKSIFKKP